MIKQVLCWLLLSTTAFCQNSEFNVNWSNNIEYNPQTTGNFEAFIGVHQQLVFGYFSPTSRKLAAKTIHVVAYDKNSMTKAASVSITTPHAIRKVEMNDGHIFIITEHYENRTLSIGCQVLNAALKTEVSHKTIYKQNATNKISAFEQYKVLTNPKANPYLYILSEKPAIKNKKIEIEYLVVDANLSVKYSGQQELPVIALSAGANGNTRFDIGNDGLIIAKNQVKADKNMSTQEKIYSYALLTSIRPEKKSSYTIPIRASGKDIEDYIFISEKNRLKIFGIYTGKDERGKFTGEKGVFMTAINTLTNEMEQTNFQKVKGYDADFETIALNKIKSHPDGSVSIIGSESSNLIFSSRNSTTYQNTKGDLYIANISKNGEVRWEKTLPRHIVYSDLFVDDLQVAVHNEQLYLVYSDTYTRKDKKNAAKNGDKRSAKEMRDFISYYTLEINSGKSEKKEIKMNTNNELSESIRSVNSARIVEFDNAFYLDGFNTELKKGVQTTAYCTSCFLGAGCIYYGIKMNKGTHIKGGGSLGVISFK